MAQPLKSTRGRGDSEFTLGSLFFPLRGVSTRIDDISTGGCGGLPETASTVGQPGDEVAVKEVVVVADAVGEN